MFRRSPKKINRKKLKESSTQSAFAPPPPLPLLPLARYSENENNNNNEDDDDNHSLKRFFQRSSNKKDKRQIQYEQQVAKIIGSVKGSDDGGEHDDDNALLDQNSLLPKYKNAEEEDEDDNASFKRRFRYSPRRERKKMIMTQSPLLSHSSSGSFDDIYKDFNNYATSTNTADSQSSAAWYRASDDPENNNEGVKLYGMRNSSNVSSSASQPPLPPPPPPPTQPKFSSVLKKYKKKKTTTPQNYQRMTSPYSLESITRTDEEETFHYDDTEDDPQPNPSSLNPNVSLEDELFDGDDFPWSPKKIEDDLKAETQKEDDEYDDDDVWTLSFPDDPFDGLQAREVDGMNPSTPPPQPQYQPQTSNQHSSNFSDDVPQEEDDEPGRIPISQINIETAPAGKSRIVSEMVQKYENYSKSLTTALVAEQYNQLPANHPHPGAVQWNPDHQSIASSIGDSLNTFHDLPLMHMQDFLKLKETDRVQAYCDLFTMAGAMIRDVEEKREDIFVLARQVDELHKRVVDVEDSKSKMHEKNKAHREEVKILQAEVESRNVVIENLKRAMDEWKTQEEDRARSIIQNSNLNQSSGKSDDATIAEIKVLKEELKAQQKKMDEKEREIRMKNRIIDEQTMQLKSFRRDATENESTIREIKDSLDLKEFLLEDVKKQLESEKKKRKKLKRAYLKKQEAETSNLITKSKASDEGVEEYGLITNSVSDLDRLMSKSDEMDTSDQNISGVVPSEEENDNNEEGLNEIAHKSLENINSLREYDDQKRKPSKISEAIQRFTSNNVDSQIIKVNGAGALANAATNTTKNSVLTPGGVPIGISYLQLHTNTTKDTEIVKRNIAIFSGNSGSLPSENLRVIPHCVDDFEKLSKKLQERDNQIENLEISYKAEVSTLTEQKNELQLRLANIESLFEEANLKLQTLQSQNFSVDGLEPRLQQTEHKNTKSYVEQHVQTEDATETNKDSDGEIQESHLHPQGQHISSSSDLQTSSEPTEERNDQTTGGEAHESCEPQSSLEARHEMEIMRRQQKMLIAKIKSLEEEIETVSGLLEETILSMRQKDEEEEELRDKSSKRFSDYSDEDVQQLERICKLHQLTIIRQRKQARAILTELEKSKADIEKYQGESKAQEEKISVLESQFSDLNKSIDRHEINIHEDDTDASSGKKRSSIVKIDASYLSSLEARSGMSTELTNQIKELKNRNEILQEKLNLQNEINHKLDDLTTKLQGRDMEIAVLKEKIENANTISRNDSFRSFQSRGRSPSFGNRSLEPRRSPEFRRSPSYGSRMLSGNSSTNNSVISLDYSLSDDEGDKDEIISKLRLIISKRDEAVSFLKDKISSLEKALPSAKGHTLDLRKISLLQEMLEASVRRLTLIINRAETGDDHEGNTEGKNSRRFLLSIGDKLSLLHDYQRVSLHLIESRLSNELESLSSGKDIVGLDENVMTRFDRCLDSLRETEEELRGHLDKLNVEFNQHQIHLEAKDDVISTLIRKDIEQKDSIDNMEMELKVFKGLSEYQSVNLGMMNRLKECSRLEQELEEKERVIQRLNNVIEEYRSYADQNMTSL